MRDLTGQNLDEVDPPPTEEELAEIQKRARRFIDREFVDEIMTPEEVADAEREADSEEEQQ